MAVDYDTYCIPKGMLSTLKSIGGFGGYYKIDRQDEEMALAFSTGGVRPVFQGDYDFTLRSSILKDAEIDFQLLLCEQGYGGCPYVPFNTNVKLCELYNDAVSKIQKESSNYIGCAEVPPQNPEAAIKELKRAVNDLDLKAVRTYGNWAGKNIEADEWWPFFEVVEELGIPIVLHSNGYAGFPRPNPYLPLADRWEYTGQTSVLVGLTVEAMAMITGLILKGVFKEFPGLKFVILESGVSWAPFLAHRLDHALNWTKRARTTSTFLRYADQPRISTPPSEYLKRHFWFTLDDVKEVEAELLIRDLGMAERLLIQTDYPHIEGSLDMVRWVQNMNVSESDKERVIGKNAAELFKVN
ncbi:MAG: amidohydrolase family protein [Conexivisphaerales archaeon]